MKSQIKSKLFLLFIAILLVKIGVSLFMTGPTIFSDEPCVIQKAIYFAAHGKMDTCENIIQTEAGNPQSLYSFLISAIYLFTGGTVAYHLVLAFNALLVASMIFPLYRILKRFVMDGVALCFAAGLLFLPQVVAFETTVMTETLFLVINVWFLHFYMNSLDTNAGGGRRKTINKVMAVALAILGVFTRPFGFVLFGAMTVNEFFILKNRKNIALFYLPLAIFLVGLTLFKLVPEFIPHVKGDINGYMDFLGMSRALVSQMNSFIVATFIVPMFIFCSHVYRNGHDLLSKMKYFLISFVVMLLFISARHIYGYYGENMDPGLLTRYINVPIFVIILFSIIFFNTYKQSIFNKTNLIIGSVFAVCMFFLNYKSIKYSLNMDIAIFYGKLKTGLQDFVFIKKYFMPIILCIYLALVALLLTGKNKILLAAMTIVFFAQTSMIVFDEIKNAGVKFEVVEYFRDKNENVVFFEEDSPSNMANVKSFDFWRLLVLSRGNVKFGRLVGVDVKNRELKLLPEEINGFKKEFNYVVSSMKLNLPLLKRVEGKGMGLTYKDAYIYKLN